MISALNDDPYLYCILCSKILSFLSTYIRFRFNDRYQCCNTVKIRKMFIAGMKWKPHVSELVGDV